MCTLSRVSLFRYGLYLSVLALVVAGTLSLDDTQSPRQAELACARAKLTSMWGILPTETFGSLPGSHVASADWDLKELGCSSGAIDQTATLDEIFGSGPLADFSYTAAIP